MSAYWTGVSKIAAFTAALMLGVTVPSTGRSERGIEPRPRP